MGRTKRLHDREQLHVIVPTAQMAEVRKFMGIYGRDKTQIVTEALQYWINTQYELYGDKIASLSGGESNGL